MDAIVNIVAEVLLLGSAALLVWGAILTVGQLVRSERAQRTAGERESQRRGPPARAAGGIRLRPPPPLQPPRTSSMILPMCCELSISSCAARASASGKVL